MPLLPPVLWRIVADYSAVYVPDMELITSCNIYYACNTHIAENRRAGDYLALKFSNGDRSMFPNVSANPDAIDLIRENLHLVNTDWLCTNPMAEDILKAHPEWISWPHLSGNPAPWAIAMLVANPEKIDWVRFSGNKGADALPVWRANFDRIHWPVLSRNATAAPLLLENLDLAKLSALAENTSPLIIRRVITSDSRVRARAICDSGDEELFDSIADLNKSAIGIKAKHPMLVEAIRSGRVQPSCDLIHSSNPGIFILADRPGLLEALAEL